MIQLMSMDNLIFITCLLINEKSKDRHLYVIIIFTNKLMQSFESNMPYFSIIYLELQNTIKMLVFNVWFHELIKIL